MLASPLTEGFHDGIAAMDYHADCCPEPSLSSGAAVDILERSPAYVKHTHPKLSKSASPKHESAEMSFGSVVHELLLGKGAGFSVWEGDSWRGKDASTFWETSVAAGKSPIKRTELARAEAVADSVRFQLQAMSLGHVITEAKTEQVAIWKSGGHYMRAMFDLWHPNRNEIWDIKTVSRSAHPDQVKRTITAMNYHMRSEFYLMGAEAITGIPAIKGGLGFGFLFAETEPPFCVTPCFLDPIFRLHGRKLANEATDIWVRCLESGIWPGYVNGAVELQAPAWIDAEIEESGISASGSKLI
jgi:hypothetical protein